MNSRKIALQETGIIAIGVAVGTAGMIGVFALLGYFAMDVLIGGVAGAVLSILNFFAMAMVATLAADKAENQDVEGGKRLIQGSYPVRLLVLAGALFVLAKSGYCNVIALVVPLIFVRPTILVAEFFRKKGD